MDSISQKLSKYYCDFNIEDMPEAVIAKAKYIVLDYIGCAIGGADIDSTIITKEALMREGDPKESTVFCGQKTACEKAAFINGVASHGLEVDDMSSQSGGHPSVVIVSAALAAAEKMNARGIDLLSAVIWGYDMMTRVGSAAIPDHEFERGWHPTAINGIFGATVAAAYLMKMDAMQMANALGIAGGFASGNLECYGDGTLTKRLNPGNAAQGAIIACELARRGYTGPKWIFEGRNGFLTSYTDGAVPEKMTEDMDYSVFPVMFASFKPYSCCRYNHSPIDGILKIVKENDIDYRDIESILIDVVGNALRAVVEPQEIKYDPPNVVGAQFSLPFSAAVAAYRRRAFIEEYTEEMIHDPQVRALMEKVTITHTGKMDQWRPQFFASETTITLKNGKSFTEIVKYTKGDPENPLTEEELEEKFITLAKLNIDSREKMQAIIDAVYALDKTNVSSLSKLL